MEQKTCEQRVNQHRDSRIEDLQILWDAYCKGDDEEVEDLGNIFEYSLCFDYVPHDTFTDQDQGYFRYQISYGGPSEEFRFYCDADRHCYKVEFWLLDWFDGAGRTLYGTDEDLMMELWDWFSECGTVETVQNEALYG